PVEHLRTTAEAIAASLEHLNALTENLNARMGPAAPGLAGIRQALEGCRVLTGQLLQRKGGDAAPAASADAGLRAAPAAGAPVRPASTRAEAYRQLEQAAAVLQELEPHSPIPYFIRRAVALGKLPYPLLMRELIRDANLLAELNREMGIREDGITPPAEGGA